MVDQVLDPEKPLLAIHASQTIYEVSEDDVDKPRDKGDQCRYLDEGLLYPSDEGWDDHEKASDEKHDANDDPQGLIKLLIKVIPSEVGDALDADDHEEDAHEQLKDEIPINLAISHNLPPKAFIAPLF